MSLLLEVRDFNEGVKPTMDEDFYCLYHPEVKIVCIRGRAFRFLLKEGMPESHALDLDYICPKCGLKQTFGLPISKEQFEESRKHTHEIPHE